MNVSLSFVSNKAFYYASQNIKCALQTKRGDGRFMNKYFVIHLKIDNSCKNKDTNLRCVVAMPQNYETTHKNCCSTLCEK